MPWRALCAMSESEETGERKITEHLCDATESGRSNSRVAKQLRSERNSVLSLHRP